MKITAAKEDDFPHIHDFLAPHEFFCTVLASKIRRREEGIFIVRTDSVKKDRVFGIFQLNGTLFHCFPDFTDFSTGNSGFCAAAEFCAEFMEFIKDKKIKCVSGEEKSSEFLMKLIEISGRKPYFRNSYILMTLKKMSVSDFPHILPDGARVVRAVSGDDRIIFGIQKNYLEEEVVPPGKVLSDFEVRISLRQILNSQIVLLVVKEKKVAAKLNTNAVGFEWIQLMKYEENVLTFLRKTENPEETLLAVCNFAAVSYENYQMGVPFYGKYKEIFNSDRKEYGGQGTINVRAKTCKQAECDEREYSVTFKIPALSVAVFSCTPGKKPEKLAVAAKKPTAAKKTTRKTTPKKESAKKVAAEKVAVKKTVAKKASEKKTVSRKTVKKDIAV